MALFRRDIPRRALIAAFIGFVYGGLVMFVPGTQSLLVGGAWVVLSVSLLFGRSISYYTYVTWAIIWVVWKGVSIYRGDITPWYIGLVDVIVPGVSAALISSSGYLEMARGEAEPA